MGIKIYQVDAFTDKPFRGNPAAVCILNEPRTKEWMQNVAREMNLSETAFLIKQKGGFNLRWFTPKVEVSLCGHATLASAHILFEIGYLKQKGIAVFNTRSGILKGKILGNWIELDFPKITEKPSEAPPGVIEAIAVKPKYAGISRHFYIIEVESEETVCKIEPDFKLLARASDRGVIVTSLSSSSDYDFVSRFFCPAVGVDEDPVTGSAHCCLGPFWSKRLKKKELIAYQTSQRGGIIRIRIEGGRVFLSGQAVTVFRGELEC